jgi:polar amino acid transport system substrate-binding protein
MKKFKVWEIVVLALAFIILITGCAVSAWYAYQLLRPEESEELSPTQPPPQLPMNDLQKIQANGKMLIGVSADYAPFEYYNAQFQIDGFDPALMREIAARMGVQVEFVDFAFDGLPNALTIGQIDLAISAISVTPERQALVLFSNVYFVGDDGILARTGTTLPPITDFYQLAMYRVGVQTKTVYETMIQTGLVDTGLMPQMNLSTYQRIDDALNALKAGTIDLVMMDLAPAQAQVNAGGVVLLGSKLNTQRYAIAMRAGQTELANKINLILTDLTNTGRLNELARQYGLIDASQTLPTPAPTATPVPNPTATPVPPPTACTDGMAYVADLNYDDQNMTNPAKMNPGQTFQKGWRIRNTGTCTWNNAYYLAYTSGNRPGAQMNGVATPIQGSVPPGAVYDIYVNLTAPQEPGVYQGIWNLFNGKNQGFGQKVWVGIEVIAAPTVTSPATQAPAEAAKIVNFSINPADWMYEGSCVTIQWQITGQLNRAVLLRNGAEIWGGIPASGTFQDCPPGTGVMTYRVEANGPAGNDAREDAVEVLARPAAPTATSIPPAVIEYFLSDRSDVQVGNCIVLSWKVSGGANWAQMLRNDQVILDNAPLAGNAQDCLQKVGLVQYKLIAANPQGQRTESVLNVNVTSPPADGP